MKTLKEMIKAKGLEEKTVLDQMLEEADDQEKEFKKRLKKACQAADVDYKSISIEEKNDTIVIGIPLKQLFGPQTRAFCADRWNVFFNKAGIEVDFSDNVEKAVSGINIVVPLVFRRDNFSEIE